MKYMTFNSSCSYAGMANLLEDYDINIEDYELAEEMEVPYIFKYDTERDRYVTGVMLQDKKYFDHYLTKKGLKLVEKKIGKKDFLDFLRSFKRRCMLGLNIEGRRHAVIFEKYNLAKETYVFLNNKKEDSSEEYILELSDERLLDYLEDEVVFSYISFKKGDYIVDLDNEIVHSLEVLDRYAREVREYIEEERSVESLERTMDSLFRPYFIDVYSMMEIIGEEDLKEEIGDLRQEYLEGIRKKKPIKLSNYIDSHDLLRSIENYKKVIERKIDNRI